jgi:hypothetical protein
MTFVAASDETETGQAEMTRDRLALAPGDPACVDLLMMDMDPELACFPRDGEDAATKAISLLEMEIARVKASCPTPEPTDETYCMQQFPANHRNEPRAQ